MLDFKDLKPHIRKEFSIRVPNPNSLYETRETVCLEYVGPDYAVFRQEDDSPLFIHKISEKLNEDLLRSIESLPLIKVVSGDYFAILYSDKSVKVHKRTSDPTQEESRGLPEYLYREYSSGFYVSPPLLESRHYLNSYEHRLVVVRSNTVSLFSEYVIKDHHRMFLDSHDVCSPSDFECTPLIDALMSPEFQDAEVEFWIYRKNFKNFTS